MQITPIPRGGESCGGGESVRITPIPRGGESCGGGGSVRITPIPRGGESCGGGGSVRITPIPILCLHKWSKKTALMFECENKTSEKLHQL